MQRKYKETKAGHSKRLYLYIGFSLFVKNRRRQTIIRIKKRKVF
jgi:hypothetical protein